MPLGMEGGPGDTVGMMGAVSALRTGNVAFDMMIAMTIPVIFKFMFEVFGSLMAQWRAGELDIRLLLTSWKMCERTVEHKETQNTYGETMTNDRDTRNKVLIKAIQLYLDEKATTYTRSQVNLISMTQSERPWWMGDEDGDERSPAGKLKKYRLSQKCPPFVWSKIGVYGGKKKGC